MLEPRKALIDQVFYGCCHLQLFGPGLWNKTLQVFTASTSLFWLWRVLLHWHLYLPSQCSVVTQQFLPFFNTWTLKILLELMLTLSLNWIWTYYRQIFPPPPSTPVVTFLWAPLSWTIRVDLVSGDILAHEAFFQPVPGKAPSVASEGVSFVCLSPLYFGVDTLSLLPASKTVL